VARRPRGGAKHCRNQKIEHLASKFVVELAPLALAKVSDANVIERVHRSLITLRDSIGRLLASDYKFVTRTPARRPTYPPALYC
jgi:hypothetical protein